LLNAQMNIIHEVYAYIFHCFVIMSTCCLFDHDE